MGQFETKFKAVEILNFITPNFRMLHLKVTTLCSLLVLFRLPLYRGASIRRNDLQRQAGFMRPVETDNPTQVVEPDSPTQVVDTANKMPETTGTSVLKTLGPLTEKISSVKSHVPEFLKEMLTIKIADSYDLEHKAKQGISLQRATSTDFLRVTVGALSGAVMGQGLLAKGTVYLVNWFLGSLAPLVPMDIVEYLLGRHVVLQDVDFVERMILDILEVYGAWTRFS